VERNGDPPLDFKAFLAEVDAASVLHKGQALFTQGDPADAIFLILKGKVQLTVVSKQGKEAIIGILGDDDFVGEGSLTSQSVRMTTATAMTECTIVRMTKKDATRMLRESPTFSEALVAHLLSRSTRTEEDLVDHLFNSSEQRLARVLLLLANFGKEGQSEKLIPKISHETLAKIVGTTRSRISFFMNKFRKLGLIHYNGSIEVNASLLSFVLQNGARRAPKRPKSPVFPDMSNIEQTSGL
jgi:CRP/FNR family transcriptional regulator, cyclic AMP receptor protein